jgi:hypothetical protein
MNIVYVFFLIIDAPKREENTAISFGLRSSGSTEVIERHCRQNITPPNQLCQKEIIHGDSPLLEE